ncbi:The BTB (BR-C, ttk and bab)/POZ (Pox virus and Zinc finger) domain [Rhizoctonia solani]|uniref:The BTB (BR-C, ttk and bab)/POZ (Pox virus and Zinc finger) domain n=1 Tax=Rhizoctonia solani TaxID=456999 RepID=A0A8H8T0U9_9AGAM|nr:The BTB (BR-C, ttk and bab)/POZ (Pox virus and Zinc finger) domain [Rhizoctonia solani]QRW24072.1 The BTB (BR-C, ttk and bab)/POZ (Pox virus and Zinc finger) domain [Rhizoctonia solani]
MSPATVLSNLRSDAVLYQLNGLVQACQEFVSSQTLQQRRTYMAFVSAPLMPSHAQKETVILQAKHDCYAATISSDALSGTLFDFLGRSKSGSAMTFDEIRILAVVEEVLRSKLGSEYPYKWQLVTRAGLDRPPTSQTRGRRPRSTLPASQPRGFPNLTGLDLVVDADKWVDDNFLNYPPKDIPGALFVSATLEAVTQSETSNKPKRKVEGKEHQKSGSCAKNSTCVSSPKVQSCDSEDEPRYTSTSEGPVTSKKAKGFTMHSFVASDRPKAAPKALEVSHRDLTK